MHLRAEMETRYDDALHANASIAYLSNPDVADLVANTLTFFDQQRYRLDAWAVMPNHVHLLAVFPTADAMKEQCDSWLHYTAFQINRTIGDGKKP